MVQRNQTTIRYGKLWLKLPGLMEELKSYNPSAVAGTERKL